jgi:hypothetical protein
MHDSSPIFLVVVDAVHRQGSSLVVTFLVADLHGKQRYMEGCPQGQFKIFLDPMQK